MTRPDPGSHPRKDNLAADFDWVRPDLALGGRLVSGLAEVLVDRFGIRRVVDLRVEEADDLDLLTRHRVELLHLPTPDHHPIAEEMLWVGVRWVRAGLDGGAKVLIHCQCGIGRSALLACCVLVSLGHDPLEALEIAKGVREKVSPSPEQLHAYLRWSEAWARRSGTPRSAATWHDLTRVAYRHLSGATPATDGP